MKEIIETKHLEFDKSAFLIDLVKHKDGTLYVEITQTIFNSTLPNNTIRINPTVLSDIIKTLQEYEGRLPSQKVVRAKNYLSEEAQKKIVDYYLKGVSAKDLALQLGTTSEKIEMVLRNKGIAIVNDYPDKRKWRGRRKKP